MSQVICLGVCVCLRIAGNIIYDNGVTENDIIDTVIMASKDRMRRESYKRTGSDCMCPVYIISSVHNYMAVVESQ